MIILETFKYKVKKDYQNTRNPRKSWNLRNFKKFWNFELKSLKTCKNLELQATFKCRVVKLKFKKINHIDKIFNVIIKKDMKKFI